MLEGYRPPVPLIDPRIAVARHIEWVRPSGPDTEWSVPEPDAYNRAILDAKPHFCEFISEQIWYHDQYRQGWIGLYYVDDNDSAKFDAWLSDILPKAIWRGRGVKLRQRRGLIWNRRGAITLNANERLYTQGYYDFLAKYFSKGDIRLRLPVGEVRPELTDLLKQAAEQDPGNDPVDLG